jgi:heterodisulfide reductase subunit D
MCRDFCSIAGATRHEADSPNHKAFFIKQITDGKDTLNTEFVDYFFRCAMCKACREACESSIDPSEIILSARNDLGDELYPETLKALKEKIVTGSIYGQDTDKVQAIVKSSSVTAGNDMLLYFGRRLRSEDDVTLTKTISILDRLGIKYLLMKDEPSTGQLAYFMGFTQDARNLAEKYAQKIDALHPKTLVVFSADDLRMIKKEYPPLGIKLRVPVIQSMPEFLLDVVRLKKPSFLKTSGPITYHDSCALGRELRLFETARELLRMVPGIELKEMAFNRDQAPCCGYGMGLEIAHPEIAVMMARRLISMAADTGAKILVTGCPVCTIVLKKVLSSQDQVYQSQHDIEIVDLAVFLDRSIQI